MCTRNGHMESMVSIKMTVEGNIFSKYAAAVVAQSMVPIEMTTETNIS